MNQNDVLQALAQMIMGNVQKADGTPITTYAYSEGGLFGSCKQDPALINAMVGPMGYEAKLQFVPTATENPIVQSLTYIGSSGYSQSTVCGDCGVQEVRRCAQTACFGRICQQTEEVVADELGLMANNNVNTLALYGNVTDAAGNVIIPRGQPITDMFMLQLMAAAYSLRRIVSDLIWTGNPAANAGGYNEFAGFDLLINTGHEDALTGIDCDALDSVIMNFNSDVVGATGSASIVAYVSGLIRSIRYRILASGFSTEGAVIDIVMHPTLWDCVADAWACEYGVNCATGAAATNDALAVAELRDQFIQGQYLTVDGLRYPVTLDNSINVTLTPVGNETARCSTIYAITRILPGGPVVPDSPGAGVITYGEYQDFTRTAGDAIAYFRSQYGATPIATTDGGRFLTAPTTSGGFCFDAKVLTKPRLRMLMPQLAGRVTNVCCIPIGTYPDITGSGGTYEVDGGASTTPPNYLYGDCWPTHVGDSW